MLKKNKSGTGVLRKIATVVIGASVLAGCSKRLEPLEGYYDNSFTEEMNKSARKPLNWKGDAPIFVSIEGASASCFIRAGVGGVEEFERRKMSFPDGAAVTLFDTGSTRGCLSGGNASVVAFWDPKEKTFTAYTWESDHRRGHEWRENLAEGYSHWDMYEAMQNISVYMENLMATNPFMMPALTDYNLRPGKPYLHEPSERLNNKTIGDGIREQIAEVNARYR